MTHMHTWVVLSILFAQAYSLQSSPQDLVRPFPKYSSREYKVVTEDGFTNSLLRMWVEGIVNNTKVAYLQHGLFDSSDTWLLNGPDASLGFLLADMGYDVWIGNNRGNQYSVHLEKKPHWDFSWDQMAKYDIPAFVNIIRMKTGAAIDFIGHSQGTVIMFAALSTSRVQPEYLKNFVALAPPVYLKHQQSPFMSALATARADKFLHKLWPQVFEPTLELLNKFFDVTGWSYKTILDKIFGPSDNLEGSKWHSHFPATTSSDTLAQWVQSTRSGNFESFSPSILSPKPVPYVVTDIPTNSVQISLLWGTNDYVCAEEDVKKLEDELSKIGNLYHSDSIDGFAHMDFTWSLDAVDAVYGKIVDILEA